MKLIDVSTPSYPDTHAMVDDADFEALNQWKWSAEKRSGTFYAIRCVRGPGGKKTTVRMHRQIVGEGVEVDHADGNGLNNQRENLRSCSVAENQQNRKRARGTSQYKGVMWDRFHNRWKAKIIVNGERINLGSFMSEEDAALQYDAAAKEHFGEFASLNFPGEAGP
ncbi:endonuclease [Ideonella dechloratans]|uniref:Endonuclease n=1 Tax=Ideonella dechloratans TaxID=36863 RepID=A0A643FBT8_IDEDE|nr:HNH endonuclease [Ideonella dechloratans]KAB0579165.1 endonuclease [Ideonella dechloratans]UFU12179.1 HNH endonuclease [Ideonella dechloratans]